VKNFRDNMCHVFVKHGKEVLKLLDELKPGEAINMHDLFHRYTLDSIGEIGNYPSFFISSFLFIYTKKNS